MATRWMKWNEGTHIFEYSTDGVTFSPLPLDASILTQGTIDPARLPPGTPGGGSNNTWTGINTIANASPTLRFSETDAPVDSKNWELFADGQIFKLRLANDAWSVFTDYILMHRAGTLQIFTTAATADHKLECSANAKIGLLVNAPNAGNASYSQIGLGNNASVFATVIQQFSSAYSGSAEPDFPNGLSIKQGLAGGISIVANAASGGIRFYTGGATTKRLHITPAGNAEFSGTITERARTVPLGEWINIAYSAANFIANVGTWTVSAADQAAFAYTVIGKTVIINFTFNTTSLSAAATYLYVNLPFAPAVNVATLCRIIVNGVSGYGVVFTANLAPQIVFGQISGNWPITTDNISLQGQIIMYIA